MCSCKAWATLAYVTRCEGEERAMGPWSFPIEAEARMAERLLEVERERMARSLAPRTERRGVRDPLTGRQQGDPHRRPARVRSAWMPVLALAACLAIGGLPAVAGGTDPAGAPTGAPSAILMRPTMVSGEWLCLHGWCTGDIDDPRVSDTGPSLDVAGGSVGSGPLAGTLRLRGPHGDWIGPAAVIWDDRTELFTGVSQVLGIAGAFALEGTASYEGWAFVGTWSDPLNGEPARVSGVIYEGPPEAAFELDPIASACGAPLLGWPVGRMGWSLGRSTMVPPYLALTACPLP